MTSSNKFDYASAATYIYYIYNFQCISIKCGKYLFQLENMKNGKEN